MKGLLCVFLILLSFSCFAQEQAKTTKSSPPPIQVFINYIIRPTVVDEGHYGYDILYQGRPVVSQRLNPFTLSPKGFSNREDVFKIARWQVEKLSAGATPDMISSQPLPHSLAKQLNINLK